MEGRKERGARAAEWGNGVSEIADDGEPQTCRKRGGVAQLRGGPDLSPGAFGGLTKVAHRLSVHPHKIERRTVQPRFREHLVYGVGVGLGQPNIEAGKGADRRGAVGRVFADQFPERVGVGDLHERLRLHCERCPASCEACENRVDAVERGAGHQPNDRAGRLAAEGKKGVHGHRPGAKGQRERRRRAAAGEDVSLELC